MKKVYIWVGVLAIAVVGLIMFLNDSNDYVVMVDQEISELEGELAEIEAQVIAGTLTPEAAAEAQIKIVNRLESISSSVQSSQKAKLTDAQKAQLNEGLERLKRILVEYQATLMVVDAQVESLPEAEKPKPRRGGSYKKVSKVVIETVTEIEEVIEEIVEDYEETPIEELFEENASSSEEWLDEISTTTEETSATTTEEDVIDIETGEDDASEEQEDEVDQDADQTATSTNDGDLGSTEETEEDSATSS